jgi:hypothetical protein
MYKNLGRERPRFKTDPTAWRSFLYYPARLVGLERITNRLFFGITYGFDEIALCSKLTLPQKKVSLSYLWV